MINLADSLVESYMYADMFNREYEGGSDSGTEKIYGAGLPVEYIVPSLKNENPVQGQEQEGGSKCKGPFTNKVVPVGLILINVQRDPDLEYEDHFYPGVNREVVPDSLYDTLTESVLISNKPHHSSYRKKTTPVKRIVVRDRSRKKRGDPKIV